MSISEQLVFLLLCCWLEAEGYNLDVVSPVTINSGLPDAQIDTAMFGFSMTYHEYNGNLMLLVGAPGLYLNNSNNARLREGGVFGCPVEKSATCEFASAFSSKSSQGFYFPRDDDYRYDGQLMGFSIHSSDDSVCACAPLFIERITNTGSYNLYTNNGKCVVLPHDFTNTTVPHHIVIDAAKLAGAAAYTQNTRLVVGATHTEASGVVYAVPDYNNHYQFFTPPHTPTSSSFDDQRGYHLERGHFARDKESGQFELFSSAPRANHHKGLIEIWSEEDLNELHFNIEGTQPDGYFGYDFALLDLQTSSYHTIIAGCPRCSQDRGQIRHTQTIDPPSLRQGQFGTAVENIGDIDNDGYDDVAISAPYDNGGVIYVYRGSADGLVLEDYQEMTQPGTIGFGYTLVGGGVDVDGNGSPDLSVGSLFSAGVTVIRTRPLINVDISFMEKNSSVDIIQSRCVVQDELLSCFTVTPCFNVSFVFNEVDRFAIRYTVTVDQVLRRVGRLEDTMTNTVTNEIVFDNYTKSICAQPYTFVLQPDFRSLEPFPVVISVADVDNLSPISDDSDKFGTFLHPVLNRYMRGSEKRATALESELYPSLSLACQNLVCNPQFIMAVEVVDNITIVPLAAGFEVTFDISLSSSEGDSFSAFFIINKPPILVLSKAESITNLAITRCETSSQETSVRCLLKNPIIAGEEVKFTITLLPNVDQASLDIEELELNFSIWDSEHDEPFVESYISLMTESIASYDLQSGFGDDMVQAARLLPAFNATVSSLDHIGPTIIYQTLISNGLNNTRGSPIPETILTITWPNVLNVSGAESPLLVPNNLIIIPHDSATCAQKGIIPHRFLSSNHTPLSLPNLPEDADIEENCPSGTECGVIQCTITDLSAQPSGNTSAVTPVQIILFATVWSTTIKEMISVSIHSMVESNTDYPEILNDNNTETLSTITFTPAVVEVFEDCFELWIIVGAVIAGLIVVLFIVLVLAMCGCFGHTYYRKKQEEEIIKQRRNRTDSLSARIIPVAGRFDDISSMKGDDEKLALESRKSSSISDEDSIAGDSVRKLLLQTKSPIRQRGGSNHVDLHPLPEDPLAEFDVALREITLAAAGNEEADDDKFKEAHGNKETEI